MSVEFVLEIELPEGRMKSDGKKITATFDTLDDAQAAVKLFKVSTSKEPMPVAKSQY